MDEPLYFDPIPFFKKKDFTVLKFEVKNVKMKVKNEVRLQKSFHRSNCQFIVKQAPIAQTLEDAKIKISVFVFINI